MRGPPLGTEREVCQKWSSERLEAEKHEVGLGWQGWQGYRPWDMAAVCLVCLVTGPASLRGARVLECWSAGLV